MAFDVVKPEIAILLREVELADLARYCSSGLRLDGCDLLSPQARITFPVGVQAKEVTPLHLALALVSNLAREVCGLTCGNTVTDRFGQGVHHVRHSDELVHYLAVQTIAMRSATGEAGIMLSDVPGLLRDAVGITELG